MLLDGRSLELDGVSVGTEKREVSIRRGKHYKFSAVWVFGSFGLGFYVWGCGFRDVRAASRFLDEFEGFQAWGDRIISVCGASGKDRFMAIGRWVDYQRPRIESCKEQNHPWTAPRRGAELQQNIPGRIAGKAAVVKNEIKSASGDLAKLLGVPAIRRRPRRCSSMEETMIIWADSINSDYGISTRSGLSTEQRHRTFDGSRHHCHEITTLQDTAKGEDGED